MQRLRTVTSLDVSAVAGHHAMPAVLFFFQMFESDIHNESFQKNLPISEGYSPRSVFCNQGMHHNVLKYWYI